MRKRGGGLNTFGVGVVALVLITIVVYLLLIETTATWQRVLAVTLGTAFVVLMGLSRVYLGHHWLTDVVAGWLIGLAWALAVITAAIAVSVMSFSVFSAPLERWAVAIISTFTVVGVLGSDVSLEVRVLAVLAGGAVGASHSGHDPASAAKG